jgi:hypothetical protein
MTYWRYHPETGGEDKPTELPVLLRGQGAKSLIRRYLSGASLQRRVYVRLVFALA